MSKEEVALSLTLEVMEIAKSDPNAGFFDTSIVKKFAYETFNEIFTAILVKD